MGCVSFCSLPLGSFSRSPPLTNSHCPLTCGETNTAALIAQASFAMKNGRQPVQRQVSHFLVDDGSGKLLSRRDGNRSDRCKKNQASPGSNRHELIPFVNPGRFLRLYQVHGFPAGCAAKARIMGRGFNSAERIKCEPQYLSVQCLSKLWSPSSPKMTSAPPIRSPILEESNTFLTRDLRPVRQPVLLFGQWRIPEAVQHRRRNNGVNCPGVDE